MPTALPEPKIVTFRLRRFRLWAYLLFALVALVMGLAFGVWLVAFGGYGVFSMPTLIGTVIGGAMAVYGAWLASYAWRRISQGDPAIVVSPEGITDRILHPGPIPWADMQKPLLRPSSRSSWQLVFDLTPEAEARIGIEPRRRQWASFTRSFGYRSYRVIFLGTDATANKMELAITDYVTFKRSTRMSRLLMGE
jgi:hypothetical protein